MQPLQNSGGLAGTSAGGSHLQPMDVDPIDDGPRPVPSSPLPVHPVIRENVPASPLSAITKEEEARQAIDMLRSEDVSNRIAAAHRLKDVASVLGPERTRDELLPFVTDGVDDEDDVLLAMAKCLGTMTEQVGGPANAHVLLRPLEVLLSVEDTIVRDAASTSAQTIAESLPVASFGDYAAMIRRLAAAEWFTARISAAGLLAAAHGRVEDVSMRTEHIELYAQLCADDTPMVRRVAAQKLGEMLKNVVEMDGRDVLLPQGIAVKLLLPLYETFAASDQPDSVRLQTAENCVAFGTILAGYVAEDGNDLRDTEIELLQKILPLIVSTIDDRSWRVRWTVAAKFADVVNAYDSLPQAMDALVPAYEKLLQDPEAEVRTAATLNLAAVARCSAPVPQPPDGTRVSVAERLVKRITHLTEDDSEHVRAALAMVATELAPQLGRETTIMRLVPPVLLLLRDAASEVRLNLISSLGALNEVIGVDLLSQSLLPAILDLAQDGKWRIRLAIIENIPLLANQLGRDFFTDRLASLCVDWLGDDIASIRRAAAKNLKELTALFGTEWAISNLVPAIDVFLKNESYLRRLTALLACSMMSNEMDEETARVEVLPKILDLAIDNVANIRFNVARELQSVAQHCGVSVYEPQVLPVLTLLIEDDDRDVRYFAEKTMSVLDETFSEMNTEP